MVGADHPDGAIGLQGAPALAEPGAREGVIVGEASEPVPFVVDAIDARVVGTEQVGGKLEIVGRVGENEIDASLGQAPHGLEAVVDDDAIGRGGLTGATQNHEYATLGRG